MSNETVFKVTLSDDFLQNGDTLKNPYTVPEQLKESSQIVEDSDVVITLYDARSRWQKFKDWIRDL